MDDSDATISTLPPPEPFQSSSLDAPDAMDTTGSESSIAPDSPTPSQSSSRIQNRSASSPPSSNESTDTEDTVPQPSNPLPFFQLHPNCVLCAAELNGYGVAPVEYPAVPDDYPNYSLGCEKYAHSPNYREYDAHMAGTEMVKVICENIHDEDGKTVFYFHRIQIWQRSTYFDQRIAAILPQHPPVLLCNEPELADASVFYTFGQHIYNDDGIYHFPSARRSADEELLFHVLVYIMAVYLHAPTLSAVALRNFEYSLSQSPTDVYWGIIDFIYDFIYSTAGEEAGDKHIHPFGVNDEEDESLDGLHQLRMRCAVAANLRPALRTISQRELFEDMSASFPAFEADVLRARQILDHP